MASLRFSSTVAFSAPSRFSSSATCAARLAVASLRDVERLQLGGVVVEELVLHVVVRRHGGQLGEELLRVVGDDDPAHRREVLALVLADDRVLDLLANGLQALVLAALVGLEEAEVSLERLQLQLRVVVPLGRLLGVAVEAVDTSLDGVDVGLRARGRRGHEAHCRHEAVPDRRVTSRFRPFSTRWRSPCTSYAYRAS